MFIGSRLRLSHFINNVSNIVIDRHTIKEVAQKDILGVILDEQLSWHEQNDVQCKNIQNYSYLLNFINQDELMNGMVRDD